MNAPTGPRPAAPHTITGLLRRQPAPDTTASTKMENATWP